MHYRKTSKQIVAVIALIIVVSNSIFCQNSFQQVTNLFNNYNSKRFQEKIYAHTDKNVYVAGEIMWFKLYDVDARYNKPSSLSKVAYAELVDAKNKAVLQGKIHMEDGLGSGSFFIPVNIASGNYSFRVYTNWMKNYSSAFFFSKAITVINTQQITQPVEKNPTQVVATFFPEGGNLVQGLQTRLAFKVTDQFGKGLDCSGTIVKNNGDTVASFRTSQFGMGNIAFTPADESYKAVIQLPSGESVTKQLPQVYKAGYILSVTPHDNASIVVQVLSNMKPDEQVYVFVQSRQTVKKVEAVKLTNGAASLTFTEDELAEGINQLTLFNSAKQPVCERLYFVQPKHLLNLQMATDKKVYEQRSKVNLNVKLTGDTLNTHDAANTSMAVYRLDSLQSLDESNIAAYLWLSSDLTGFIQSPETYFNNTSASNKEAIDNLMLINGWRRFDWDAVFQNQQPAFQFAPEYNGHIISGKITDANGAAVKDVYAYVSVPGKRTQFVPAKSDENGVIRFEMKQMYGSSELIAQTDYSKDSLYKIDIDNPFLQDSNTTVTAPFTLPAANPVTLLDQSINAQVQNMYLNQKLRSFNIPTFDTATFFLHPDLHYNLDDYTRFTTMEEVLREYVQFVDVRRRNKTYSLLVFDPLLNVKHEDNPLFLLDAVPVFDMNKAMQIDPLKIKTLDVVTPNYFYGSAEFPGVLNLISYEGNLANYELDPHAVVLDYEGLQLQRTFYSPQYDVNPSDVHVPDFRNVLYWNPQLQIHNNNSTNLSFFTSDVPGKYAIIVQGLSTSGRCGSSINYFEVK